MSRKYLTKYEDVSNPRTIAQRNFDVLEARTWFATPNPGAGVGPPTTGTWAVDELYWDVDRNVWRCTVAGTPGSWVLYFVGSYLNGSLVGDGLEFARTALFFPTNGAFSPSDISPYLKLPTKWELKQVNNSYQLSAGPGGSDPSDFKFLTLKNWPGVTYIPAGKWKFSLWCRKDPGNTGTGQIYFEVYLVPDNGTGTPSLWFTTDPTAVITSTTGERLEIEVDQLSETIAATDRILVRSLPLIAGNSGTDTLFFMTGDGTRATTSWIETPIYRASVNDDLPSDGLGTLENDGYGGLRWRPRDIVNVKDYGAVGDGLTNDTEAIEDALDATPEGGALVFPHGTYLIEPDTSIVKSDIRVIGLRAAIKPTGVGTMLISWTGSGLEFDGLVFDGDNQTNRCFELYKGAFDVEFRCCRFTRATQPGAETMQTVGLRLRGNSHDIKVTDCWFEDIFAPNNGLARGVLASVVDVDETYFRNLRVISSTFKNIGTAEDGDCVVIQNFANNVQALISDCYAEPRKRFAKMMSPGFTVSKNRVKFAARGTGLGEELPYSAVSIYADDGLVADNTLEGGCAYGGIEIGTAVNSVARVTVRGNHIRYGDDADLSAADGIQIVGSGNADLIVVGNVIKNTRVGIRVACGGDNIQILGNHVDETTQAGIRIDEDGTGNLPNNVGVHGNQVSNTGSTGIQFWKGSRINFSHNNCRQAAGVYVDAACTHVNRWNNDSDQNAVDGWLHGVMHWDATNKRLNLGASNDCNLNVANSFSVSVPQDVNYGLKIQTVFSGTNSVSFYGPFGNLFMRYSDAGPNLLEIGSNIGVVRMTGASMLFLGPANLLLPVVDVSASGGYTVTDAQRGSLFTNRGASSFPTFNLPTPTVGIGYGFLVVAAAGLIISPSSSATIRIGSVVSATGGSGGYVRSVTPGDFIYIEAVSSTEWLCKVLTPMNSGWFIKPSGSEVAIAPSVAWGDITGTLSDQTDLQAELDGKADVSHNHTLSDIADLVTTEIGWQVTHGFYLNTLFGEAGSETEVTDTDGFPYFPSSPGFMTSTPSAFTAKYPFLYDNVHKCFQWYDATISRWMNAREFYPHTDISDGTMTLVLGYGSADLAINQNTTFSTSERLLGRQMVARIKATGVGPWSLTWPGWTWVTPAPASLATGKTLILRLYCWGTNDSDVSAEAFVEA